MLNTEKAAGINVCEMSSGTGVNPILIVSFSPAVAISFMMGSGKGQVRGPLFLFGLVLLSKRAFSADIANLHTGLYYAFL